MKKILIVGANSYIGNSFQAYIRPLCYYHIDSVSASDGSWETYDFSRYNVVLHLAGLVHRRAKKGEEELYNKINCNLAMAVAQKAKQSSVEQFVFMSTAAVYGKSKYISIKTKPLPCTYYGKSKLMAEERIKNMEDEKFKVVILRPPMIYGKNCPGNFYKLVKLISLIPFFPKVQNKRSMIYIDNLCEFIRQIIDKEGAGYFHPQNKEHVETLKLAKSIAGCFDKKLVVLPGFSFLRYEKINRIKYIEQLFGDFYYEPSLSAWNNVEYNVVDFEESIKKSIRADV